VKVEGRFLQRDAEVEVQKDPGEGPNMKGIWMALVKGIVHGTVRGLANPTSGPTSVRITSNFRLCDCTTDGV
jgi:hypothetical protein